MKIQPDIISSQSIQGYGPGWVQVAGEKISRSVIIGSGGERLDWDCQQFEDLQAIHFEQLAQLQTELVIFGSGTRLRFVAAGLTRALIERQIGLKQWTRRPLAAPTTFWQPREGASLSHC